ncbi:Putative integral inner membrane protein [Weissella tructae]|uniref:Integral inner membrane protein n=1 Tax=Weissella tructae TaxID=887702 RepID=A0ABM5QR05_9LACO|nr:hypothetical protein [Weissella tructae]AIG65187.1 Putative integral inner membrane protein [Weissella tructae]
MSNEQLKTHTIFMCMVTTMVCVSFFTTMEISWHTMQRISLMLLIMWPVAFSIKQWVTMPIVRRIHEHVLPAAVENKKRHTFPLFVILINSGLITFLLLAVAQIYPSDFLATFLDTWEKKLMVLIPLFFFVLRPSIEWLISEGRHDLVERIESKSNTINSNK